MSLQIHDSQDIAFSCFPDALSRYFRSDGSVCEPTCCVFIIVSLFKHIISFQFSTRLSFHTEESWFLDSSKNLFLTDANFGVFLSVLYGGVYLLSPEHLDISIDKARLTDNETSVLNASRHWTVRRDAGILKRICGRVQRPTAVRTPCERRSADPSRSPQMKQTAG